MGQGAGAPRPVDPHHGDVQHESLSRAQDDRIVRVIAGQITLEQRTLVGAPTRSGPGQKIVPAGFYRKMKLTISAGRAALGIGQPVKTLAGIQKRTYDSSGDGNALVEDPAGDALTIYSCGRSRRFRKEEDDRLLHILIKTDRVVVPVGEQALPGHGIGSPSGEKVGARRQVHSKRAVPPDLYSVNRPPRLGPGKDHLTRGQLLAPVPGFPGEGEVGTGDLRPRSAGNYLYQQ